MPMGTPLKHRQWLLFADCKELMTIIVRFASIANEKINNYKLSCDI
jgi:hypothetical protein